MADAAELISMCSNESIGCSKDATHPIHALDLKPAIFTREDLMRIGDSLFQYSEWSLRRSCSTLGCAMAMLWLYRNRAGVPISEWWHGFLQQANVLLR
jgi:hypothetical protein